MPILFPGRRLLALPLMAPLFGCAERPAGPPIVLRPPPQVERQELQVTHRSIPRPRPSVRAAAQTAPASEREAEDLSPEEKESLFRDFDDYLSRSGRH